MHNYDRQVHFSSVSQELWKLKQLFQPRPQEDQLLKSTKAIKVAEKWPQQRANKDSKVMMQHACIFPQMNTQLASLFLEKKIKRGGENGPGTILIERQANKYERRNSIVPVGPA